MRDVLIVAVLALLPYLPSLGGGFVYDDVRIVREDARVATGDLEGALTEPYWGERHGGLYRPVTTASFVLEGLVSREPLGYRLVNVALHAAASVLALALARRLTSRRAALIAAAIFAVHPIHVEVAANVVGRAESLGFLLAGLAWLIAVPAAAERRPGPLLVATILATLGILSKENALAVALAAPLECLVFKRRGALLAALPAIVATLLALAARRAALGAALTPEGAGIATIMNPLAGQPLAMRLANAPSLLLAYVRHLALPLGLAPDYGGFPLRRSLDPLALAGAAALLGAPAFFLGRRGAFASAFLLGALLPVLQVVTIGTLLADRLAYAASFGFALAIAHLRFPRGAWALLLGALAAIATADAMAWKDGVTLFRRALPRAPGSVQIPYVLGQLLGESNDPRDLAEARECLARAAALAPSDPRPLLHLGFLEHRLGALADARVHLERALTLHPREEAKARAELGFVLLELRDMRGAEDELARSSELSPDARVLATLGSLRASRGDSKGAREALERSLALDPGQEKAAAVRSLLEGLPR